MSTVQELQKQARDLESKLRAAKLAAVEQEKKEFLAQVRTHSSRAWTFNLGSRNISGTSVTGGLLMLDRATLETWPREDLQPSVKCRIRQVRFVVDREAPRSYYTTGGLYTESREEYFTPESWDLSHLSRLGQEVQSELFHRFYKEVQGLGAYAANEFWARFGGETLEQNADLTTAEGSSYRCSPKEEELDIPHIQLEATESTLLGAPTNPFIHGSVYLVTPRSRELAGKHLDKALASDVGFCGVQLLDAEYRYLDHRRQTINRLRTKLKL